MVSQKENKPIPNYGYLNSKGEFTTDINEISAHKLSAPIGGLAETYGYKGYGLAFMFELLTAGILGGMTSDALFGWNRDVKGPAPESHMLFAMKPGIYCHRSEIDKSVQNLMKFVKARSRKEGVDEILLPGEDRYKSKKCSVQEGVRLTGWQIDTLKRLAEKYLIGPKTYNY